MAFGTLAFDTLSTSGVITGTAKSVDADYILNGSAKVLFNMNLRSDETMEIANNGISSECLNISSGTDAGTGRPRGNITNAMQNKQYVWTEGCLAGNNTMNLDVGAATTILIPFNQKDADSSNDVDAIGCSAVVGDLA
jgi:hypothetical protein